VRALARGSAAGGWWHSNPVSLQLPGARSVRGRPAWRKVAARPLTVLGRVLCRAGHDIKMTNYLLLGLAAFQFPFGFWLGIRPAK